MRGWNAAWNSSREIEPSRSASRCLASMATCEEEAPSPSRSTSSIAFNSFRLTQPSPSPSKKAKADAASTPRAARASATRSATRFLDRSAATPSSDAAGLPPSNGATAVRSHGLFARLRRARTLSHQSLRAPTSPANKPSSAFTAAGCGSRSISMNLSAAAARNETSSNDAAPASRCVCAAVSPRSDAARKSPARPAWSSESSPHRARPRSANGGAFEALWQTSRKASASLSVTTQKNFVPPPCHSTITEEFLIRRRVLFHLCE
mmetsp:Transcript_6259/g.22194  ORF Transcript_6259/g.22194 Transcript_6259/m.22194 type:complete len:264 (-) Transcript_6259:402-1193(-)